VNSTTQSEGERAAEFVQLYTSHARRVYTYILTLVPNRSDAEEVFSELSIVLWEKFDSFERGTNFGAWACRVSHYKVLQFREANRRRAVPFSQLAIDAIDRELVAMDASLDGEYQALAECFEELDKADRNLIERRYAAGGSPRAIAEQDRRPITAVYKALARVRKQLFACVTRKLADGTRMEGGSA
jgi:RNA polymerase sigma-70 factor (ECF subfamily)